jgi:hypothetical protein
MKKNSEERRKPFRDNPGKSRLCRQWQEDAHTMKGGCLMKKAERAGLVILFLTLLLATFLLSACSHLETKSDSVPGIAYEIPPGAEITKVSYYLKQIEGSTKLFFDIGLKNTTQEAHVYRVTVFLHEGPSGSIMYPIKGKLEPKKELVQNFLLFHDLLPKGYTLLVEVYD